MPSQSSNNGIDQNELFRLNAKPITNRNTTSLPPRRLNYSRSLLQNETIEIAVESIPLDDQKQNHSQIYHKNSL